MRRLIPIVAAAALACGEASVPPSAHPTEPAARARAEADDVPPLPQLPRECEAHAGGGIAHLARVGDGAVVWTRRLEPRGPQGYDAMAGLAVLELRDRTTLALRWRREVTPGPTAVAVSADGDRIAVAGVEHTLVVDAADGAEVARIPGAALQLAFGPGDVLAVAGRTGVAVHAPPRYRRARDLAVTGMAPTVIHAMRTDGTCDQIFDRTEAHSVALAFGADGTLYAGVSDGSVRALDASQRRFDLPDARRRPGYAIQPIALAARRRDLITVWNDGRVVILDPRLRPRRTLPVACSEDERTRAGGSPGGSCSGGRFADVRDDRVAMPGRLRTLDGATPWTGRTLHDQGVLQVGEELWHASVSGTIERWTVVPADPSGRFDGYLPVTGESGWVRDVSPSGRYVAVMSPRSAVPLARIDEARASIRVWDTATEDEVVAVRGEGTAARFLDERRVAIQRPSPTRIEIVELASGDVLRTIPVGGYEYAGLVDRSDERLVLAIDDGRARVVDDAGHAIEVRFGAGTITRAELDGDIMAALIFEASEGGRRMSMRLEVYSLDTDPARRLHRVEGVHRSVLELTRGAVVFVLEGTPTALRIADGSRRPVPGLPTPTRWLGRAGASWVFRGGDPGAGLRSENGAFGPPLLDPLRIGRAGDATIVYELGGAAYVVGPDGRTRGSIASMDGGFVVLAPTGHVSRSDFLTDALTVREGAMRVACDPAAHRPDLLRRLVR